MDGNGEGVRDAGAVLALAYTLGLGIPLVLFALMLDRTLGLSRALSEHRRMIGLLSDALSIAIGVLLMAGVWPAWMSELHVRISAFEPVV